MILIIHVELVEVAAPAPYTDDKVLVILGVLLRVKQHLPVDRVKLKLMPAFEPDIPSVLKL